MLFQVAGYELLRTRHRTFSSELLSFGQVATHILRQMHGSEGHEAIHFTLNAVISIATFLSFTLHNKKFHVILEKHTKTDKSLL